MRLTEKHLIKRSHRHFKEIDKEALASKNLFNSAVYICRQAFFKDLPIPSFNKLYHQLKIGEDYKALPSKVAQLVIKQVDKCFKSYLQAIQAYAEDRTKFLGKPTKGLREK